MRAPVKKRTASKPKDSDDFATEVAIKIIRSNKDEIAKMVRRHEKESKSQYELATELKRELDNYIGNAFFEAARALAGNPKTAAMQAFIPPSFKVDYDKLLSLVMDEMGKSPLNNSTIDLYFDMGGKTFRIEAPDMGDLVSSVEEYDRVNGTEFADMVENDAWYTAGRRTPSGAITIRRFDDAYDAIHAESRQRNRPRAPARKTKGVRR